LRSSSQSISSSAKGAALRVTPELSDPVGSLEAGELEDVEKFGSGSQAEGVQALSETALKLVGSHCREATPWTRRQHLDSRTTFLGPTAQATL
jgi:hypothetical protein